MIDILHRFCANKLDMREHLRKPFAADGFAVATSGAILVRVPYVGTDLPAAKFDVKQIFKRCSATEFLPLPALPDGKPCLHCNGKGRIVGAECDACEGDGEFEHGRHSYSCKECDGDGFIEGRGSEEVTCRHCNGMGFDRETFEFGRNDFDLRYLLMIAALPGAVMADAPLRQGAHFKFDGGEGVVMPMTKRT